MSDSPTRNAELLREVADEIEAAPKEFDMGWHKRTTETCGTTMCIAGWAVDLSPGIHMVMNPAEGGVTIGSDARLDDGGVVEAYIAAADLLGLTCYEAADLFHSDGLTSSQAPTLLRELADGGDLWDLLDNLMLPYYHSLQQRSAEGYYEPREW